VEIPHLPRPRAAGGGLVGLVVSLGLILFGSLAELVPAEQTTPAGIFVACGFGRMVVEEPWMHANAAGTA